MPSKIVCDLVAIAAPRKPTSVDARVARDASARRLRSGSSVTTRELGRRALTLASQLTPSPMDGCLPRSASSRPERSVGELACEAYCRGVTITDRGRITGDLDGAVSISVESRAAGDLEFANV